MSSFIVDSKHINSCAHSCAELFNYSDFHKYPFRDYGLYVELDKPTPAQVEDIVFNLFKTIAVLNATSFHLQYGNFNDPAELLEFKPLKDDIYRVLDNNSGYLSLNKRALYKALCGISYQIEYDRVLKFTNDFEKCYNFLDLLVRYLAYDIANGVTEKNDWHIYNDSEDIEEATDIMKLPLNLN